MSETENISREFEKEVSDGLALVRYLNLAFGEGLAGLAGDGTSTPHVITVDTGCGVIKDLATAYNRLALVRWVKG